MFQVVFDYARLSVVQSIWIGERAPCLIQSGFPRNSDLLLKLLLKSEQSILFLEEISGWSGPEVHLLCQDQVEAGSVCQPNKILNNRNNNHYENFIKKKKNGMFFPDCEGVVVFNYAISIAILIIFSTNKPPLIKAKLG